MNNKKTKKDKISFKPISKEHIWLTKKFCLLMGYKYIIDNDARIAVIIDQSGQKGLLQTKEGQLCYYWKGKYEPITVEQVNGAKSLRTIIPLGIRKIFYGVTDLNKRAKENAYSRK